MLLLDASYLLTTSTTNDPGLMVRCGRPPAVAGGVSVYSAAVRNIFLVFGSKAIVFALGCVLTAPASSYSSADFSWKMLSTPSLHEKKISLACGSNPAKSTPLPIGKLVMTFPDVASMTTIFGSLRQPMNNLLVFESYAKPVGVLATPIGKRFFTSNDFGSKTMTALVSSPFK